MRFLILCGGFGWIADRRGPLATLLLLLGLLFLAMSLWTIAMQPLCYVILAMAVTCFLFAVAASRRHRRRLERAFARSHY